MIAEAISKLVGFQDLSQEEARGAMEDIMEGRATSAQMGAFMAALRMKGETPVEVAAFAKALRERCRRIAPMVPGRLLDTAGTGGDIIKTFNVSTLAAIIAAGAGAYVAKHGGRSVTSGCGSADLLERLGYNSQAPPETVKLCIEQAGIGFMYAPIFHPAMQYAVSPRREVGMRTVFNILGPLTNPADAKAQLVGVFDARFISTMASALAELGVEDALVVHGRGGLDELSTFGVTYAARVCAGQVKHLRITPLDFGIRRRRAVQLHGTSIEESAELTFRMLNKGLNRDDPLLDMALINASAALVVAGIAYGFKEGVEMARLSVDSGMAYDKLRLMVEKSGGSLARLEELEKKLA